MLRHSAGAITIMLGVVLLPLIIALFMPGSLQCERDPSSSTRCPNALAPLYGIPFLGSDGPNGGRRCGSWPVSRPSPSPARSRCSTRVTCEAVPRPLAPGRVEHGGQYRGAFRDRCTSRGAAVLRVPAGAVPVPALVDAAVLAARPPRGRRRAGSPGRSRGSGSACRRWPRDRAHHPLLVLPALGALQPVAVVVRPSVLGSIRPGAGGCDEGTRRHLTGRASADRSSVRGAERTHGYPPRTARVPAGDRRTIHDSRRNLVPPVPSAHVRR